MGTEDLDCEMELKQMRVSPRNVARLCSFAVRGDSVPNCPSLDTFSPSFWTTFLTASLNPPLFYTFYFTCTPNSAADRSAPACGGLSETFVNVSARNEAMFHTK